MEDLLPLLVLIIIIFFGVLVFFLIRAEKAEKSRKSQLAQGLGFEPVEPDKILVERIGQLYENKWGDKHHFELRNVFRKQIPDGEMYLFDLVNTGGDEESYTEDQAIAVLSRYLKMPEFIIIPQVNLEGFGGKFANSLLQWVVSKAGNPVDFQDHPKFQQRYLVSSHDEQGTRQFLDDRRLHLLAQARSLGIHASGDLFVLSKVDQVSQPRSDKSVSERVSQAMDVYQIFTE